MDQFATVAPEGLKLHRKADFASETVTELVHGDRVKVLQRRQSAGGTMMTEVMVSRTPNGIQVGLVGWARDSLLQVEHPRPVPPPPDVPRCEPDAECKPLPLGKYIGIGLLVVAALAALAWVFDNI